MRRNALPTVLLLAASLVLAGCAAPGDGDGDAAPACSGPDGPDGGGDAGGGGDGFAPQRHHAEDTEGGLCAEGDLRPCDAGFCVDARAANDGERTFHVSSICVPPWSERMTRDGEVVEHREPMVHCLAFGTEPFPPGAERVVDASWDGRVWNGDSLEPAPPGAYVWSLLFRAYGGPDGGEPVDLVLEFPVVVGAT